MRTLQNYINIYRSIADNLNIKGDSVELLVQLLANSSYISEVENINYALEGSLEKCSLINSKIQHCEDNMYSVFRGKCPRVILNFQPTKYFNFSPYDQIISSNNFKIYYLGYLDNNEDSEETTNVPILDGFRYGSLSLSPTPKNDETTYTIIGLLASNVYNRIWSLDEGNKYFVNCQEKNLSNDMYAKVSGEYKDVSRIFSDHILNHSIFDLTTTDFGSRLYVANILDDSGLGNIENTTPANLTIEATYFGYSTINSYNRSELEKITLPGAKMIPFDPREFLEPRGYVEIKKGSGVVIVPEISRDDINTIHYRANKERFVSTVMRSNSDIGVILEETYPEKVISGGTDWTFSDNNIHLYYVPADYTNPLTSEEIEEYKTDKRAYYITDDLIVESGKRFKVLVNLGVALYQDTNITEEVNNIFKNYSKKFRINLEEEKEGIRTLISKIPDVRGIDIFDINYLTPEDNPAREEDIYTHGEINPGVYFDIEININTIVKS